MKKHILFAGLALVLLGAGLIARSMSAREAKSQAAAILATDKASKPTTTELAALQDYVGLHMGSGVTVTLEGTYARDQAAALAASKANDNSKIYADAQAACAGKSDSVTQAKCNQAYLAARLVGPTPTPVPAPKLANYQYKLTSPAWTPDIAGALLLGAAAALGMAGITWLRGRRQS